MGMSGGVFRLWWVIVCICAITGCTVPEPRYASLDDFAPNTPRPLPEPLPKPDPPPRGGAGQAVPSRSNGQITATVRKGDTVYALSRRYDTSPRAIIDANDLSPPYTVYPGQELTVPAPRYHVVEKGDTGYGISRRYGVDVTALMRANDISEPYILRVGQKLRVPGGGGDPAGAQQTRVASSAGESDSENAAASGGPVDADLSGAVPDPPPRSDSAFAWPVRGKLVSRFGPKSGGRHNDGINIAAPKGAPVRAAENGVVAYAGDDLADFGNLILIRHDGGWVTAYAHNAEILVERGDTVQRGQTIARVGTTGSVDRHQLHFEIRKGTRAVDPEEYL